MLSFVITNSLCLTQKSIWSLSTVAFEKNSLMISQQTTPTGFNSVVQVLSLNTSRMKVSSRVSSYTTLSIIMVALLQQSLYFISTSTDLKLSKSVRERLVDFLVAECLVADICTNITENKKQKQVHRHKDKTQNLIRFKLVQNKSKTT